METQTKILIGSVKRTGGNMEQKTKEERQIKIKKLVLDGEEHTLDEISRKLDIPKQFISKYLSQLEVERKLKVR